MMTRGTPMDWKPPYGVLYGLSFGIQYAMGYVQSEINEVHALW